MNLHKQDVYGLSEARFQARNSKDPSTKCGAVILRPTDGSIVSTGWNGLPPGIDDAPERLHNRETKLMITLHAEENALLRAREPVDGYTMYVWPFQPCAHCAAVAIAKGIRRIVTIDCSLPARWLANMTLAGAILDEAEIELYFHDSSILPSDEITLNHQFIT